MIFWSLESMIQQTLTEVLPLPLVRSGNFQELQLVSSFPAEASFHLELFIFNKESSRLTLKAYTEGGTV